MGICTFHPMAEPAPLCTASVSRLPYWSLVRAVSQQAKIISLFFGRPWNSSIARE